MSRAGSKFSSWDSTDIFAAFDRATRTKNWKSRKFQPMLAAIPEVEREEEDEKEVEQESEEPVQSKWEEI